MKWELHDSRNSNAESIGFGLALSLSLSPRSHAD